MRLFIFKLFLFTVCFFPIVVLAANSTVGIGHMAEGLLEPANVLSDFMSTASLILGASFIFASFSRYMQHRKNPLAFPISTVIMLLILGVMLVCLPIAVKFGMSNI